MNKLSVLAVAKQNKYIKTYSALAMNTDSVDGVGTVSPIDMLRHGSERYLASKVAVINGDDDYFNIICQYSLINSRYDQKTPDSLTNKELKDLFDDTANVHKNFEKNGEYIDYQHYIEGNPWEVNIEYNGDTIQKTIIGPIDPLKALFEISKDHPNAKVKLVSDDKVRAICINGKLTGYNEEVPELDSNSNTKEHFKKKWNSISLN